MNSQLYLFDEGSLQLLGWSKGGHFGSVRGDFDRGGGRFGGGKGDFDRGGRFGGRGGDFGCIGNGGAEN